MDTATVASTARRGVIGRSWARRRPRRGRRLRVVGAAGFAGVSVALLATQSPERAAVPDFRFGAQALVNGLLAVPVRFADAGSAVFLRPGDRIDVLAADDTGPPGLGSSHSVPDGLAPAEPITDAAVATNVSVLETTGSDHRSALPRSTDEDGGLVFLAVDNATAERLARAAVHERLSYALHAPQRR